MSNITIIQTWQVAGTPTDVDQVSSVYQAFVSIYDTTASSWVVGTGTTPTSMVAMTRVSAGDYQYVFTGGTAGHSYSVTRTVIYGGTTYTFPQSFSVPAGGPFTSGPLTCNYTSLVNEVGYHLLGLRPTSSSDIITAGIANANQSADILRAISKGLQFVYAAYRWSFLRPVVSIATAANINNYSLPVGFDSLESELTFPPAIDIYKRPLKRVSELEIRRKLERNNVPGLPCEYALTTGSFDPTAGSFRFITFYPIPDATYTLSATMTLRPTMIDAVNQYPLGIEILSGCLVESCLAAAERDIEQEIGIHNQQLQPLLAMAIQRDKEYSSPDSLGREPGHMGDAGGLDEPVLTGNIFWNAGGGINGYI